MSTGFPVPSTRRSQLSSLAFLVAAWVCASSAHATATLGFRENWTGTTLSTWSGGSTYSNPGTGGIGGLGDGMLVVSNTITANLGVRSQGPEYAGNWVAAGITQVRVWLSDIGNPNPLEIHFGIGRDIFTPGPNVWQYNVGLIPPSGAWGEYVVDLTSVNWTQVQGSGTFADAVSNVQTIHLRHDVPPFMGNPDPLVGDFAVDHLLLTNGQVGVDATPPSISWPRRRRIPRATRSRSRFGPSTPSRFEFRFSTRAGVWCGARSCREAPRVFVRGPGMARMIAAGSPLRETIVSAP
jgi:hypothetical protein